MGFHTYDVERADSLEDAASRYRYLSREELLHALDPSADDVVADVGSGTGFYTDDVAPHAGRVYAVDVQVAMHEYYRRKGVPSNVDLVTAGAGDLPFADDTFDGIFSTMTYHEFADDRALAELARVCAPGATVAIADWTATGDGEAGPPLDERFSGGEAHDALVRHDFEITSFAERRETFLLTAVPRE